MSMCLGLVTLSDANLQRLLQEPPLIWRLLAPDDPEFYREQLGAGGSGTWLGRLFGRQAPAAPPPLPTLEIGPGEGREGDLDKAWHGIHYLLTGTACEGERPWNFLLLGGEPVGDIDVGYGPARALRAEEVQEVVGALASVDRATLQQRFDPDDMTRKEIYPDIWHRDPNDDNVLGYCLEYFDALQTFMNNAAGAGLGVVIYLS